MGMTITELKAKLAGLNRRTDKAKDIWKPRDEHDVRLLAYPFGDETFIELHFHYEIGENTSILCPSKNFGEDCAICDFAEGLRNWKGPDGEDKPEATRKADWELFKKIQAKARVFVPMVERAKGPDGKTEVVTGPWFWGVTPNQGTEILSEALDPDRMQECGVDPGEEDVKKILTILLNPKKAYDLHVSFAKPGEKGNTKSFPAIKIKAGIKAKPISKDEKFSAEIISKIKNIKDVYPAVPSSEVEKMLRKWMGNGEVEASVGGGTEKYSGSKEGKEPSSKKAETHSNEKAATVGTQSIDDAFGELAGDDE
jgi:hypothetical protein